MANLYCCLATTPHLLVRDAATGAAIANLTMGDNPYYAAVAPDGSQVAVSFNSGNIQFVTAATNTAGSLIATGLTQVAGLVWAPDSSKVYMQAGGGGTSGYGAIRSCTPAGTLGSIWSFVPSGGVGTTVGNGHLAISTDGTKLYSTTTTGVSQVDTTSGAVTAHYVFGGSQQYGICISPDGSTLYVSDGGATPGNIYPITIAGGTVGTPLTFTGTRVMGLALSADGHTLWSAQYDAATVCATATSTLTVSHTIAAAGGSNSEVALTPDGSICWASSVTSTGPITPINTSTFTAGSSTSLGNYTRGIACVPAPTGPVVVTGAASVSLGPVTLTSTSTITSTTVTGTAVLMAGPVRVVAADFVIVGQGHAAIFVGPVVLVSVGGRIGPGAWPIPGYRGRWRLTLHNRAFAPATLGSTMIAELGDARGRQIVQAWNQPATLTFTLDGRSQSAGLVEELLHDVVAWRWDDQTGLEQAVFRGPITQSQDQITTEAHVVTFTCHDYTALLARRLLTATYTVTARDQDLVVGDLLGLAGSASSSSGTSFSPASFLPVALLSVDPAGVLRGLSGVLRDETYYGSQNVGTAIDNLAKLANGFDYETVPSAVDDHDSLRVYWPRQGVTRTDVALQYGSTVATITRSVDSSTYSNYVRVLGNNASASPTPQLYAEDWTADAHSIANPVGLWMLDSSAAANTVAASLADQATGTLNFDGVLSPSYTLGLTPGAYTWGNPDMGDTVALIIASGRLDVNTTVRVLGITYAIGDDGQEDVALVVSRPQATLGGLFSAADRDIKALARR